MKVQRDGKVIFLFVIIFSLYNKGNVLFIAGTVGKGESLNNKCSALIDLIKRDLIVMRASFELSSSRSNSSKDKTILFVGSTLSSNVGLDAIEMLNRCVNLCITSTESSDVPNFSFDLNSDFGSRDQTINNIRRSMFELAMVLSYATFEQLIFLIAINAKSFLEIVCKVLKQRKFYTMNILS